MTSRMVLANHIRHRRAEPIHVAFVGIANHQIAVDIRQQHGQRVGNQLKLRLAGGERLVGAVAIADQAVQINDADQQQNTDRKSGQLIIITGEFERIIGRHTEQRQRLAQRHQAGHQRQQTDAPISQTPHCLQRKQHRRKANDNGG